MSTAITLYADHAVAPPPTPLRTMRGLVLAGVFVVVIFVFGAGIWSAFAPLEQAAIASGVVEAESSRKTIQHLEGGIIGKILVHDGEAVEPGQVLIRLDDTKPRTTLLALEGQMWDALAAEARLYAERDGLASIQFPKELTARAGDPQIALVLAGQEKIFETRRSLLQSKTELIDKRIAQVKEEIVGLQAQESAAKRRIGLIQEEL
jgi:HlyD family secretion protein